MLAGRITIEENIRFIKSSNVILEARITKGEIGIASKSSVSVASNSWDFVVKMLLKKESINAIIKAEARQSQSFPCLIKTGQIIVYSEVKIPINVAPR